MKPVANWQAVLRHAWSLRLIALAFVLTALEVALPLIDLPVPPSTFAILAGLATAGAFVARLVAQKSVSGDSQ